MASISTQSLGLLMLIMLLIASVACVLPLILSASAAPVNAITLMVILAEFECISV